MGDVPLSLEICGNSELDLCMLLLVLERTWEIVQYVLLFCCKLDVNPGMNMIYIYIHIYVPKMWKYLKRHIMHVFLL